MELTKRSGVLCVNGGVRNVDEEQMSKERVEEREHVIFHGIIEKSCGVINGSTESRSDGEHARANTRHQILPRTGGHDGVVRYGHGESVNANVERDFHITS
jgi:hypothetical protein